MQVDLYVQMYVCVISDDFCILILCLVTLLNSIISSSTLVDSLGFSKVEIM